MQIIYEKYSSIVGFMVMCVIIQTMLGTEILNQFLLLVLLSMILLNAEEFITMLGGL